MNFLHRSLTVHPDKRGSVREAYRASWLKGIPPVTQIVHSESEPNVMRAMHVHDRQYDLWHFVTGKAFVQLYDANTGEYHGDWYGPNDLLVIPPGVAHGFYTPTGSILTYFLTREYDPAKPDEFEFDAFDTDYPGAVQWPLFCARADLIRSQRDLDAKSFLEWLHDYDLRHGTAVA